MTHSGECGKSRSAATGQSCRSLEDASQKCVPSEQIPVDVVVLLFSVSDGSVSFRFFLIKTVKVQTFYDIDLRCRPVVGPYGTDQVPGSGTTISCDSHQCAGVPDFAPNRVENCVPAPARMEALPGAHEG